MKPRRPGALARLRLVSAAVFVALALPAGVLVRQAWQDLRWEALHGQRVLAQELVARIDARLRALIAAENARPATDYAFLNLAGDPRANFVQRSPLAAFPVPPDMPGAIGYFEVDALGRFATPLLPPGADAARFGVAPEELAQRQALAGRMVEILARNRLVRAPVPAPEAERAPPQREAYAAAPAARDIRRPDRDRAPSRGEPAEDARVDAAARAAPPAALSVPPAPIGQAAFDALEARQSQHLDAGGAATQDKAVGGARAPAALARKERSALPALADAPPNAAIEQSSGRARAPAAPAAPGRESPSGPGAPVRIFESEVDPFVLGRLESGHFVLYRRVWRDGARAVQGLLLDPPALLAGVVDGAYRESAIAASAVLEVRWRDRVLARLAPDAGASPGYASVPPADGQVLLSAALGAPFDALSLAFTSTRLPPGPGAGVVAWTALTLALMLVAGLAALYRLGAREIALARDQRDFVTRVSHELRTPLTSIRLYGEMLAHGWADPARQPEYHAYIHDEAQRLSRLIDNVLTFGRAGRDDLRLDLAVTPVAALMDLLDARLAAPVRAAGFALRLDCPDDVAGACVRVDADAFVQVAMNLVDNALKFAAQAPVRVVEVSAAMSGAEVVFGVRDHGPGIARRDLKRVFRPFYRAAGDRNTPGTGIGLALVQALTRAMGGRVQARNADPGARFTVSLARV